jgi:rubrerythrin
MKFEDYITRSTKGEPHDNKVGGRAVKVSEKDARLLRMSIMEELDAVNDYMERAERCENDAVRKVFLDIAQEERVHFSEFEMLLEAVDPNHEPAEDEAEDEFDEMFGEEEEDE